MKERYRLSSGQLLLLELVLAITFFGLTIAVTLAVFGNAYEMSVKAEAEEKAVSETNNVIEIIRSASDETEIEELLKLYGLSKKSENIYEETYGNDKYTLTVNSHVEDKLYTADISCFSADEPIYAISVEHAIKKEERK